MMMKIASLLVLLSAVSASLVVQNEKSQVEAFTCTLSAQDESSCLDVKDDDGSACVWCALSSFGFCVGEAQAEKMEQSIPGIACDRKSDGNDDQVPPPPATDDVTPPPPATDDITPPPPATDDTVPDNFWKCLQDKNSKECSKDGCTWCNTKGGFGLCLTGPTADSASQSDWFDCKSTTDMEAEWDEEEDVKDPYDTACLMAYLQNPTPEGCQAAVDGDGEACEFCNLQGSLQVCLNAEQATMGQQFGLTCQDNTANTEEVAVNSPYDPTCVLAYLQDQSEDTCKSTMDSDGNACEYCTLQGSVNLCLTEEQAQMGQQLGIECDATDDKEDENVDLPPDFFKCLQNYEEGGCVDDSCTWCTTQVGIGFCLSTPAAEATSDCTFFDCDIRNKQEDEQQQPFLRLGSGKNEAVEME